MAGVSLLSARCVRSLLICRISIGILRSYSHHVGRSHLRLAAKEVDRSYVATPSQSLRSDTLRDVADVEGKVYSEFRRTVKGCAID